MPGLSADTKAALAQALAWERGRDEPTQQDVKDADAMVERWNENRAGMGLQPFT